MVECSAQISLKRIYCRDPSGFRGRRGQLILGFNGFVSFNQESAASLSVLQPFRWFPALGLPSWGFHPGSEPLHIRVDLRGSAVPPRPDWAWFYHLFVQNFWIDLCNPKKDPIRSENFCLVNLDCVESFFLFNLTSFFRAALREEHRNSHGSGTRPFEDAALRYPSAIGQ